MVDREAMIVHVNVIVPFFRPTIDPADFNVAPQRSIWRLLSKHPLVEKKNFTRKSTAMPQVHELCLGTFANIYS